MQEFHLENMLARYPELIEPGLTLLNRQCSIKHKRIDLMFRDQAGNKLVVEVKVGVLCRADIGQLSEYCHYVFEMDGLRPRGMLVGTRVPDEIRGAAGFNGFECKCLTLNYLEQVMSDLGDQEIVESLRFSRLFESPPVLAALTAPSERRLRPVLRCSAPQIIGETGPSGSDSLCVQSYDLVDFSIADMLRSVLFKVELGTVLKAHEITSAVLNCFPGKTTLASILLSDKCYNITNARLSANYDFRIFEYVGRATYRYLGEGYPYSGHVTWKGVRCGLWTKGVLTKWDNWPVLRPKAA
jgi:hypothetical protein